MQIRRYFIFFSILLAMPAVHAQTVGTTALETAQLARRVERAAAAGKNFCIPWMDLVGDSGLYPFQITHQLKSEAKKALEQARAAHQTVKFPRKSHLIYPQKDVLIGVPWQLTPLHEDRPYLEARKHLSLYFVNKENRLIVQEIERLKSDVWPQFRSKLVQLERAAAETPQMQDPLPSLIRGLSPQVNTLFVGEMHYFDELKHALIRLLTLLQTQQPGRKIILFTEFLPQDFEWEGKVPEDFTFPFTIAGFNSKGLISVWDQALKQDIPVVGLEPKNMCLPDFIQSEFVVDHWCCALTNVDTSLSGIQYRNEKFAETLQHYREKYPDALFVVYTGAAHSMYNKFASISARFKPEETFVLLLQPTRQRMREHFENENKEMEKSLGHPLAASPEQQRKEIEEKIDNLHPLKAHYSVGDFPQAFIQFDKELAPVAGFDAFVRVQPPTFIRLDKLPIPIDMELPKE